MEGGVQKILQYYSSSNIKAFLAPLKHWELQSVQLYNKKNIFFFYQTLDNKVGKRLTLDK